MKKATTKRVKKTKAVEKPIHIILKLNDSLAEFKTDNVLHGLRELGIEPQQVKTFAIFNIKYNNVEFNKVFRIPQMRMLLMNDMRRMFFAKLINQSLGIPNPSYE